MEFSAMCTYKDIWNKFCPCICLYTNNFKYLRGLVDNDVQDFAVGFELKMFHWDFSHGEVRFQIVVFLKFLCPPLPHPTFPCLKINVGIHFQILCIYIARFLFQWCTLPETPVHCGIEMSTYTLTVHLTQKQMWEIHACRLHTVSHAWPSIVYWVY